MGLGSTPSYAFLNHRQTTANNSVFLQSLSVDLISNAIKIIIIKMMEIKKEATSARLRRVRVFVGDPFHEIGIQSAVRSVAVFIDGDGT